jgi:hypothetical protein
MTPVRSGDALAVDLKTGGLGVAVSSGTVGPPGLMGPPGPAGESGGFTVPVGSFGLATSPADLPPDGLVPAHFDGPGRPASPRQMAVGQSMQYVVDGFLWVYVGPDSLPDGWFNAGQARGPQGAVGPPGDQGDQGPNGPPGPTGPQGGPGPAGGVGERGPQGAQGAEGPPGSTGAPGPKGDDGGPGPAGAQGPAGPEGPASTVPGPPGAQGDAGAPGAAGERGEAGDQGDPGAPSFIVGDYFTRQPADLPPTGLIPVNWDGPGRPPVPYQMKIGEALIDHNPANPYQNTAFSFTGQTTSAQPWINVTVTGPQGDAGPPGPPGEVTQAAFDALAARVAALESALFVRVYEIVADRPLNDGETVALQSNVLPQGTHLMSAQLSFDLAPATSSARVVTAWWEAIGAAIIDGPRAAQLSLHQALPMGTLSVGPARMVVTGTANAVLYVRVEPAPNSGAPSGTVTLLRATASFPQAGASASVAA